jgi:hypothetical protein
MDVEAANGKPQLTDNKDFAKFREVSRETRSIADKRKEKENISPSNSPSMGENDLRKEVQSLVSRLSAEPNTLVPSVAEAPYKAEHRNEQGLMSQLTEWGVPLDQIRQICGLSHYGEIGHPVWQYINEVRMSRGKITMPGLFLISRLKQPIIAQA